MVDQIMDLSWGEPVCVRETLNTLYKPFNTVLLNLEALKYPEENGEKELVGLLKKLVKKTTGHSYDNLIITNGCNQALNIVLRSVKASYSRPNTVKINEFTYPYYNEIILKNDCKPVVDAKKTDLQIIDSPSNPEGKVNDQKVLGGTVVWDSVYHNPIYMSKFYKDEIPNHDIICGSLSKITGLTGLRLGFIAFDSFRFNSLNQESRFENNGVSLLSQSLAIDILKNTDLEEFFKLAKIKVDHNREEIAKLESLFPYEVAENGSFYFTLMDDSLEKLLKKSKVMYYPFFSGKDKYARFNLAQNNDLTRKAVKSILNTDRS